jgi:hypothetical protein
MATNQSASAEESSQPSTLLEGLQLQAEGTANSGSENGSAEVDATAQLSAHGTGAPNSDSLLTHQIGKQEAGIAPGVEQQSLEDDPQKVESIQPQKTIFDAIDGLATELDTSQKVSALANDLFHDTYYKSVRKPLSERILLGERRAVQTMSYIQLVEDRLVHLETKLDEMKREVQTLAGQPAEELDQQKKRGSTSSGLKMILEITRFSASEEQTRKANAKREVEEWIRQFERSELASHNPTTYEGKLLTGHIIDVVVPKIAPGDEPSEAVLLPTTIDQEMGIPAGLGLADGRKHTPLRVRIHSTMLLRLLEHISDQEFSSAQAAGQSHLTFMQPFKLFVTYESEIRGWAERLEQKYLNRVFVKPGDNTETIAEVATTAPKLGGDTNPITEDTPKDIDTAVIPRALNEESTINDPVEVLSSFECLKHLRVLIQLFDDDLKPVFDACHAAETETHGRSVAFADLWHVFAPGEEVQSAQEHPQICRVLTCMGGRQYLCTRVQADMPADPHERAAGLEHTAIGRPFIIKAFSYDFNGAVIGVVEHTFIIPRFEGRRLITSLPCFPIRFAREAVEVSQYRQKIIDRGRKFVELATNSQNIHCQYSGLTLEEVSRPKEQVTLRHDPAR